MVTPLVGPNLTHWDVVGGDAEQMGVWRDGAAGSVLRGQCRRSVGPSKRIVDLSLRGGKTGEKPFPIPVKKSYDKKLASPRNLSVLKLSAAKFSTAWFMSTLCSDRTLI